MTKNAFIFFLLIFQLCAFFSNAAHVKATTGKKFKHLHFVMPREKLEGRPEFLRAEKVIPKHKTIIRTDKPKWKEDLSKLLRHKYSSYTFPTIDCYISSGISLMSLRAINAFIIDIFPNPDRVIHLPGYYSFLHRLCLF